MCNEKVHNARVRKMSKKRQKKNLNIANVTQ